MQAALTIIRYPKWLVPVSLLAMAIFRLPLWLNKKILFYKLMGTGKNGSFDLWPEWQQWAIFTTMEIAPQPGTENLQTLLYGNFISRWFKFFRTETCTFILEPIQCHGSWDGKIIFDGLPAKVPDSEAPIAVLTRASIRLKAARDFWRNVPAVNENIKNAGGLIYSVGVGETPVLKQATFSIWKNKDSMMEFAYGRPEHQEVIKKTRKRDWYSEEMFCRFSIIYSKGTIKGINPLKPMD
ncbi:MAG: spheroidene monooxygenase [Ferruginibacter sp.]